MAILSILLTVVIIAVSILMVMVVLVQRPKQEGLGAAFGGGAFDSALGAHTTDILQKLTTWLGVIFFVSAIGLAMVKTRQFRDSAANDLLKEVENKEAALPALPPELSNLPGLEGLVPTPAEAPAPAANGASKTSAPAPAKEEAKPAAPEAAAPAPAAPAAPAQPEAPAKAPAPAPATEGGKANE